MRDLPETLTGSHVHVVTPADTADNWGNDLPVLATPVLLWLGEVTAMNAVQEFLEDDEMTVGVSHDSSHLAPTLVGQEVRLTAVLRERRGSKLRFEVRAHDGETDVLHGVHTRAVVHRKAFLDRLADKERQIRATSSTTAGDA